MIGWVWNKNNPVIFLSSALCTHRACIRYANDHLDPPTIEESRHNIYLTEIQPLMHRASVVMKAIGFCEWRLLFQSFILQPCVEYTPLATPLECFITDQIPRAGTTPSSHIHKHYEEPSHQLYAISFLLLGEQFDCIFYVGGYKHGKMSRRAAKVAIAFVTKYLFEVSNYPCYICRTALHTYNMWKHYKSATRAMAKLSDRVKTVGVPIRLRTHSHVCVMLQKHNSSILVK